MGIQISRTCHFKASENIMTKFKSQALDIIRIKLVGVATLSFSFPSNGTLAFYVINRQLAPNILVPSPECKKI